MIRVWLFVIVILGALGVAGWASDFITMQGERTVYTVECAQGQWDNDRCTGKLVLAPRYRYRALKPHSEVIFWTVGGTDPSGKFSECTIQDGRNWICKPNGDASRSITLQMSNGAPIPGPATLTRPFHAVTKWRWHLLEQGISLGSSVALPKHLAPRLAA